MDEEYYIQVSNDFSWISICKNNDALYHCNINVIRYLPIGMSLKDFIPIIEEFFKNICNLKWCILHFKDEIVIRLKLEEFLKYRISLGEVNILYFRYKYGWYE